MYSEDQLLPLSGLQHMAFCERRWALVHIEGVWADNRFTVEGKLLHERAHSGEVGSKPGTLIRRTLPVRSLRLGIAGQTDVVEFQPVADASGIALEGHSGRWRPYPVEYKRSRDKAGSVAYQLQLCAQAICLEEMLETEVPEGAVYDGTQRRRQAVAFHRELRDQVAALALLMHELSGAGTTPRAHYEKKCDRCSLFPHCLPKVMEDSRVEAYVRRAIAAALPDAPEGNTRTGRA